MNVIYLSPHFPPNYHLFCRNLRELGANVLGVAEDPHEALRPEVANALTDYYRVGNMEDHSEVLRAVGYFTHRYGKVDRVESHNEHWIELEAFLRENFNVFGKKLADTQHIKHKSLMKQKFIEAGVDVAPGRVAHSLADARAFTAQAGYPIIAKPDRGVGAAATYRITSDPELESFFSDKPPVDYFLEGFVTGQIVTFDGLTDHNGNIVFYSSLEYSRNVMDVVNEDDHVYYYTLRDLPDNVVQAGFNCVRAFDVREKFFHLEFFRTTENVIVGLEINVRPPGGFTTDMFNYANDFDIYREWANIVVHNRFEANWQHRFHCIYIGRKRRIHYRHPHEEIARRYADLMVHMTEMPPVFSKAMGDFAYIARSPSLDELQQMAAYVHARTDD